MDNLQQYLFTNKTTRQEWLNYYKNMWIKNCIAQSVDVKHDQIMKDKNPEERVMQYDEESGQPLNIFIPVKQRLELRKISLERALAILRSVEALEEVPEAEFENKMWSKEALAVSPDMIPKVVPPATGAIKDETVAGLAPKV